MEDSLTNSPEQPRDETPEEFREANISPDREVVEPSAEIPVVPPHQPVIRAPLEWVSPDPNRFGPSPSDVALRRRSLRHNLFLLLALTLAAFALTTYIFVHVESPFGFTASGARDVVRAQLQALDRGELRSAYGMFSAQYRQQVSFDEWNQLVLTHWRMFHAQVLGSSEPEQSGSRVLLEIHLRGVNKKQYRARFTLIELQGRWWVDDLHWSDEPDERNHIRI